MPAPATGNEFLDAIRESGVIEEQRLEEFIEKWYAVSSIPDNPRELADELIKASLLTAYQRDQLFQGKRKGFVIADKYILLGHLGAGGMGSVYLCEHKVMRRRVALKVLPPTFAKDPEYLQRFHRESRAAAALDHPNIVRAYDVDQDGKMHFLVMEYIEGTSLHDLVRKEGPLEVQRAANYISQAAAGLEHAHEAGLVHRDIKPSNLLVDRKGTVKILDMGLALFFQEKESLTQQFDANAVLGTADYLAPEQVIDSHGVDLRADIYSLGLTFYFLLTGKSPYGEGTMAQKLLWHQMRPPKSVREFRPEVPEEVADIIAKMIAKEKEQRYQTHAEVVEALSPWVAGLPEAQEEPELLEVAEAPADDQVAAGDAPTATGKAGSTLDLSPSPPATAPGDEEKTAGRAGGKPLKTTRGGKQGASTRRLASEKSGKLSKGPGSGKLASGKQASGKAPRSSTKLGRSKTPPPGFWNKQRIVIASSIGGGVLVVGLIVGIVVIATSGKKTPPPGPSNPTGAGQVAQSMGSGSGGPMGASSSKVAPTRNEAPPKATSSMTAVPPPATKPSPAPPTAKQTNPIRTMVATNTKLAQPPEVKPPPKPEPLADYYPKPGDTKFYDVARYANNVMGVERQKWEFKDNGTIDITPLKSGLLEGGTLLGGGKFRPTGTGSAPQKLSYHTTPTHIELAQYVKMGKPPFWDPILPLSAVEGDTWKGQLPNGDFKKYTLLKLDLTKDMSSALVKEIAPLSLEAEIVTLHTYVKGKGEVQRSWSVDVKGQQPQLVGELKLVEE